MAYQLSRDKFATAPEVDQDENEDVLELTLDDLSYVAGGETKPIEHYQ